MTIKGSAAVTESLIQTYPEETVLARLKEVYRTELRRAIAEVSELLPRYRRAVGVGTYARDHAKLRLVEAYLYDDSVSVPVLERSLKFVRKQQRVFAGALS